MAAFWVVSRWLWGGDDSGERLTAVLSPDVALNEINEDDIMLCKQINELWSFIKKKKITYDFIPMKLGVYGVYVSQCLGAAETSWTVFSAVVD